MKELKSIVKNSHQPQHIKPEELAETAQIARQRAMGVRRQAASNFVVETSYNLGGWKGLFEENIEPEVRLPEMAEDSTDLETPVTHLAIDSESTASPSETNMPLCPSGRAEAPDAVVFGVVGGTVEKPEVSYLKELLPVTEEINNLSGAVKPTEMFRIASSCAASSCQHFDGSNCRLAMRVVEQLPSVVESLPPCHIRSHCRWWQQEGKAACMRCPQVITDNYNPSDLEKQVAMPR